MQWLWQSFGIARNEDENAAHAIMFPPQSASSHAAHIPEIIELLFLNLSYGNLLRCQQVCRFWRACIANSPKLQTLLWKLPVPLSDEDPDPHFVSPPPVCAKAVLSIGDHQGESVLGHAQARLERYVFSSFTEADCERYKWDMYDTRCDVKGVRIANGWPEGYREIYCHECDRFHLRFRNEHLHPLLRFLEDTPLCVKGSASHLMISLRFVHTYWAPSNCYDDANRELVIYANNLKHAYYAMKDGKLNNDLVTQPTCTVLIGPNGKNPFVVRNKKGITVQEAMCFLVNQFNEYVKGVQIGVRDFLEQPTQLGFHGSSLRDRNMMYPEPDGWEKHLKECPEILVRFLEAIAEVEHIMIGISDDHVTQARRWRLWALHLLAIYFGVAIAYMIYPHSSPLQDIWRLGK